MSEVAEVFQMLIFGDGAYVGFILLASIMSLVTLKAKIMGFIFVLMSTLLMVLCFDNVASSSNLMWVGILYGVLDVILIALMLND